MAEQQLRVFVSHSSQDKGFCQAIVAALRGAGADVWYDDENLDSGQLMSVIQRELGTRPIFVLILSKAAFASKWVRRETMWAYEMADRDPSRVILPVTAGLIDRNDFDPQQEWLFLHDFKRVEQTGYTPYPVHEAANRLLHALALTPAGEAPAPVAPQPSESVDDLLTRGKALNAQNNYAEALPLFERATQLAPGSFEAWANLGLARNEIGLHGEDIAAYDRALALDSNQSWVWNNKGNAFKHLSRFEEALAAYDRALTLDPNNALAWNNKSSTLFAVGRTEDALAASDRTLAIDPNITSSWTTKSAALYVLKRYPEALDACERALAIDSNYPQAWNNKGVILRALGRTSEADAAKQRAKELGWQG